MFLIELNFLKLLSKQISIAFDDTVTHIEKPFRSKSPNWIFFLTLIIIQFSENEFPVWAGPEVLDVRTKIQHIIGIQIECTTVSYR